MKDVMEVDENPVPAEIKVVPSILDAFEQLRHPKDDKRVNGATKIIGILHGNENDKNIQYALKRLIRSLGANLPENRTPYFGTLVGFLKNITNVTVTQLLDIVKKELHANGSSKSEVGDVALGQILVCGAIFRSGLMLKCTGEEQQQVMTLILKAAVKKSYLGTVAYLILLDFVNKLNQDQFSSIVWCHMKSDFKKQLSEHNLDSLYFLIVVSQKYPTKVKLSKLIGVMDILCPDNVQVIAEKLMTGLDLNLTGHPIHKEIGTLIANSDQLEAFWTQGIDLQLQKHNRNRELAALTILTNILLNINQNFEIIPELLSKNFFKLFMDWFKGLQTASKIRNKRDNEDDHKIMIKKEKELLNSLVKALKKESVSTKVKVATLKKLLFTQGEMNFTELTGTNVVKAIIGELDVDGVKKMAKLFKAVLLNTSKKIIKEDVERSWYNNERLKAAELISYLVSHDAVKDDTDFKLTYMKLLMCFGFFKIGGDDNVAISMELAAQIKSCFYRCFTSRFSNVDSLVEVLGSLCHFINSTMQKEETKDKIEKQFSKENTECWEMINDITQKIESVDTKSKIDKVFLILLYQLGLFLFSEPTHVKMARSSIKELKSCYEHYRKGKNKQSKKAKDVSLDSDEPEWIEVLVEVLLSILSAESSVLRSVVQCVFRLLREDLTPSSIGQLLSVLDPEGESNPLSQDSDSENEDSDSDDDKDVEKGDQDDEGDANNSEDSDLEDDDDDDEAKIPEQLKMAVQKALGTLGDSDNESVDADMITEEEGQKLDEALADAFKQFQHGKGKAAKKDRKDKKALSDFRIRVLDLVDLYLDKETSMDACLSMIAPLLRCLEFCLQDNQLKELENRIRKTIKNLTRIRKFASNDDVTVEILSDYLKSCIEKGERSHFMFQALGDVVTNFATFIINCSLKLTPDQAKSPKKAKLASPLTEIVKENLQSYFSNRNCQLPVIFFHSIFQIDWEGNFQLIPIVIDNVFNNSVRQFRRNEGLELICGFYKSVKRTKPMSVIAIKKLPKIEKKFDSVLRDTLKSDGSEFVAKNNYFSVLKKLLNIMKAFHNDTKLESSLEFDALIEIVSSYKGVISGKKKKKKQPKVTVNGGEKKTKKKNKKKRKNESLNGHPENNCKRKKNNSEGSALDSE